MKAHRFGITVVAVAPSPPRSGQERQSRDNTPPWLDALNARSEALNREYGLGDHAERRELGGPGSNWREALQARSAAMNRVHGLGEYARQGRSRSAPGLARRAERPERRAQPQYGLGD